MKYIFVLLRWIFTKVFKSCMHIIFLLFNEIVTEKKNV